MKPEGWDDLPPAGKRMLADEFMESKRAWYIISQALHYAIKELNKAPAVFKEMSNIEDMEMLRETIFNCPILEPVPEPIPQVEDE